MGSLRSQREYVPLAFLLKMVYATVVEINIIPSTNTTPIIISPIIEPLFIWYSISPEVGIFCSSAVIWFVTLVDWDIASVVNTGMVLVMVNVLTHGSLMLGFVVVVEMEVSIWVMYG